MSKGTRRAKKAPAPKAPQQQPEAPKAAPVDHAVLSEAEAAETPEPEIDIDLDSVDPERAAKSARREAELDAIAETGSELAPEPNPLVVEDPNYEPVYNPTPYPVELRGGGDVSTVRARGVDLVLDDCIDINLGAGYGPTNKALSRLGLRRLRQFSNDYIEPAQKAGVTVETWILQQNERIKGEADAAWEAAQHDERLDVPNMTAITRGIPAGAAADHQ